VAVRLFTPLRPDPAAPLARANPVAKLAAAALLMGVLFVSVDAITPAVVLVGLLGIVPFTGLGARDLLARTWPILLAALAVGVLNALLASEQHGAVALQIGPIALGSQNLLAGLGLGLRLLAIALSGVLAVASTDPTDLADAIVQQLHVSPRFAVGALAGARLLPMLASEWQTLALARRARGVSGPRSPTATVQLAFGQLLALLVGGVRRATRLATAMEARGFDARPCRTVARPQRMHEQDWMLLTAAAALAAVAVGTSVVLGSWRFFFG
jgi:energy-coupling factor transport system permease protein